MGPTAAALITLLASLAAAAPVADLVGNATSLATLTEHDDAIPGRYMVSFKDGHTLEAHENHTGLNLTTMLRHHWDEENYWPPYGYEADLDDTALAIVRADPMIDFVEQDYYITFVDSVPWDNATDSAAMASDDLQKRYPTTQKGAPFNLVIASANGKRTGRANGNFDYDTTAQGLGVDIYIVDSGINIDHEDFDGRASNGYDATDTVYRDESVKGDVHGHGTIVADVAGGTKYGVAKKATLRSYKVAFGPTNNSTSGNNVRAIKLITRKHKANQKNSPGFRGSVINYSINIPPPKDDKDSLYKAITAADDANIVQVAAAGNSNNQAINQLPAAYPVVIAVASMTDQYQLSASTSFGTSVDMIAPGTGITGAAADSDTGYYTLGGTSFAAPLVSGVLAQFMSYANGPTTVRDVKTMMNKFAIKDAVDLGRKTGTINYVINNGANTQGWPGHDETR